MRDDNPILRPSPGYRGTPNRDSGSANATTVSRPRPGGRPSGPISEAPPRPVGRHGRPSGDTTIEFTPPPVFERSALLDAAAPLLSLTPQLRYLDGKVNVPQLHLQAVQYCKNMQHALAQAEIKDSLCRETSYVLCALLDETVLNTPWGENSTWSQKTLLSIFHHETYGGQRFFDILAGALNAVPRNHDFIELLYLCLSLGFMGKYRIDPQGKVELEQLRAETYRVLQGAVDRFPDTLSADTKPESEIRRRLNSYLPLTLFAGVLALASFAAYAHWLFGLNQRSDQVHAALADLVPKPQPIGQEQPERPLVLTLRQLLAPEIQRGVLSIEDDGTRIRLVLQAEEMFASGRSDIDQGFYPVLDKIAKALEATTGRVVVAGHTDDRAIRTPQFPSNWHLSLARASAVVKYMSAGAALQQRLLPEGRGATEPVASNATAEGRAQNRRVELEIIQVDA